MRSVDLSPLGPVDATDRGGFMSESPRAVAVDKSFRESFYGLLSCVLEGSPKPYTPTCSCVLAVDLGLPTKVAYLLLELLERQGKLIRIDLKPLVRERQDFHRLLSGAERQDIEDYEGELSAYFEPEDLGDTHELLGPLVIELALMLRIQHVVLFYDAERLKWGFQVATKALREGHAEATPNPVGERAGRLGEVGEAWRRAHQERRVEFEGFEVNTSTQLRILMHLALLVAGGDEDGPSAWPIERLWWSTPSSRSEILHRLGRLLLQGVETSPMHRSGYAARVLGHKALTPDHSKLWTGDAEWYRFVAAHRDRLSQDLIGGEAFKEWLHLSLGKMACRWNDLPAALHEDVKREEMGEIYRRSLERTPIYV